MRRLFPVDRDLARRFALGQAMRTHGPLARKNVAVSLRRDDALFSHVRHRELSFQVIHFELSATPGQRPTRSNSNGVDLRNLTGERGT